MKLRAHVLVVDDDPSLLRMVRILLESEDLSVTTAKNGVEALRCLHDSPYEPDLVLLDLQMPLMDGRMFYSELRARGYASPVLVMSAYGAESAREELGAEGSVSKPFDPLHLASCVQEMISKSAVDPGFLARRSSRTPESHR